MDYKFTETVRQSAISRLKISTLLPQYIQTRTNTNFFDATFQQLFSEDTSETVSGYIGEKPDRLFSAETDFYIEELTSERQKYQLTPAVISNNAKYTYRDIVNHLKYQGANIESHERLFRQDFYSFSPMIDINKFLNFNQYYWVQKGPRTIETFIEVEQVNVVNNTIQISNHSFVNGDFVQVDGNTPQGLQKSVDYTVQVVDTNLIKLLVNNVEVDIVAGSAQGMLILPQTDFSDIIGKKTYVFYGRTLSNGMVIRTFNDRLQSYNGKRYIVEGVGDSIILIEFDELLGYDSSPYDTQPYDYDESSFIPESVNDIPSNVDYVTIQRGCKDGNSWSMRNRWFHISVLTNQEISASVRANRPIIEYVRDIELFEFGSNYKGSVNVILDSSNLQSFTDLNTVTIDGETLGDGSRILVTNDVDSNKNFTIWELGSEQVGASTFKLVETLIDGDVVFVRGGSTFGQRTYFRRNNQLIASQTRTSPLDDIRFQLYDADGNKLNDTLVYPESNFQGSRLFTYKTSPNNPIDPFTQRRLVQNEFGEYVFVNELDTIKYAYISDFVSTPINGFYYFKLKDQLKNHWHKSDVHVNQAIIDEFIVSPVWTGNQSFIPKTFKLSQNVPFKNETQPVTIKVTLNGEELAMGVDFDVTDENGIIKPVPQSYITIRETNYTVQANDLIKVFSYNDEVPVQPISGYYEVPTLVGLTSNIDNVDISEVGRNDIFEHFISILDRQDKFVGNVLGNNNGNDIKLEYGRGNKIVQNTASLVKMAVLNADEYTDVELSLKYAEGEYVRFYNQFNKKIADLNARGFDSNVQYSEWINTAISEINLGKSQEFPFFNSKVAGFDYIPPSPSYLGITPIYLPYAYYDLSLVTPQIVAKGHDGRLIQMEQFFTSQEITVNEDQFRYPIQKSVVFPWEIVVQYAGSTLVPNIDYTIFGGNSIDLKIRTTGSINVFFIESVTDRVKLFFENTIYNSSPFKEFDYKYDFLKTKPGYFRKTDYTYDEYNEVLSQAFFKWLNVTGGNYIINDTYDETNEKTWNYSGSTTRIGDTVQGSWRAIFDYYYDTVNVTNPWEMLGFASKPSWWSQKYGDAPYTSSNFTMWNDIEAGIIADGPRKGQYEHLKRPNLRDIIPVDDQGIPLSVIDIFRLTEPNTFTKSKAWKFGDIGAVEFAWRSSPSFMFGLLMTHYLLKPNNVIDLTWQPEILENKNNNLVNTVTGRRLRNSELSTHNLDGQFTYGFQQYTVGYLAFNGKTSKYLDDALKSTQVKLVYPVGGFIDKNTLRMVADNFGLVPSENLTISVHKQAPTETYSYSGIILIKSENGYTVYGYDPQKKYFEIKTPILNSDSTVINVGGKSPNIFDWVENTRYSVGTFVEVNNVNYRCIIDHRSSNNFGNDISNWIRLSQIPVVGGINVTKYNEYEGETTRIFYGEELTDVQDIANLFFGYEAFLEENGFVFDPTLGISSFDDVLRPVLLWFLERPQNGDTRSVSPFANAAKLNYGFGNIVDISKNVNGYASIVSNNDNTISLGEVVVDRSSGILVQVLPDQTVERMYRLKMIKNETEHMVIIDNRTNFGDVILDDITGIRQTRFKCFMNRSTNWTGKYEAEGFIISDDTIQTNIEKSASDFNKFYDSEKYVIGQDFNLAAKKLVGFTNRQYFTNLLFDDRDAFQFYLGFLRDKGTNKGINRILRNDFIKNITNIDVNEEWAVKIGEYGAVSAFSNIDFKIPSSDIRSNPQVITFTDMGEDDPRNNIIEISPDDPRFIFKRVQNIGANQFKTSFINSKLPSAGYARVTDVKFTVPFLKNASEKQLQVSQYDRIWVAETGNDTWGIYRVIDSGNNIQSANNNVIVLSSVSNITVGSLVISNHVSYDRIFEVENINGNTVTLKVLGAVPSFQSTEISGSTLFILEPIRFSDMNEFNSYGPIVPWVNGDIAFIDGWTVIDATTGDTIRQRDRQVDVTNIVNSVVYDNTSKITVADINLYHPNMGKLPAIVQQNLDYVIDFDPAKYNSPNVSPEKFAENRLWLSDMVGKTWWNLSAVRYIDYDQGDILYKTNHWGAVFPETNIEVYQWTRSPVPPSQWQDFINDARNTLSYSSGSTPYSTTDYVVNSEFNPLIGRFVNYYYFWVKGNDFIPVGTNKTLSSVQIERSIQRPTVTGIRWFSPISNDSMILANVSDVLTENTNVRILFRNENDNNVHGEWYIFGPKTETRTPPSTIFTKAKHSLVGYVDIKGSNSELLEQGITQQMIDQYGYEEGVKLPVPDQSNISSPKYGNSFRPRQSWFPQLYQARQAFVIALNDLMTRSNFADRIGWEKYLNAEEPEPSSDIRVISRFDMTNLTNLNVGDTVLVENDIIHDGKWTLFEYDGQEFIEIDRQTYRVSDFWEFDDYYIQGFDKNTPIAKEYPNIVSRNSDIQNLNAGDVVKVLDSGNGNFNISRVITSGSIKAFELVGKQNATFKFSQAVCDCQFADIAIGFIFDGFMDVLSTPQTQNEMLIDLFQEVYRQNQYVDWVFKTSFVDLIGLEEELVERPIVTADLTDSVRDYFNETKPYHTKTRLRVDKKVVRDDVANISFSDTTEHTIALHFDRVSCVADMTLPRSQWTAAERIQEAGGIPSEIIPGCKFRGTEIDGANFTFFNDITNAGYDNSPYDGTILGYDYRNLDLEALYDAVINGTNFVNLPEEVEKVIIDGGQFYQPLLNENRPPELSSLKFGDTLSVDISTLPFNVLNDYGYDTQGYDVEIDENGNPVGYDYIPSEAVSLVRRPRIRHDMYVGNGSSVYPINNIPQSNDAVMVYVNGVLENNYIVIWQNNKPAVAFNTAPSIGSYIKIVSFGTGGIANIMFEGFIRANTTTIDLDIVIQSGYGVYTVINGEYAENQTFKDGFTDLNQNQIRIPSVNSGDNVFVVIYDSAQSSLIFSDNFVFSNQPQTVNISRPLTPPEVYTVVYKNGNRLVPAYIRYFDPVVSTTTFYLNEQIYEHDFITVYVDKVERNDYTINILDKTITFTNPIVEGQEVLIINKSISEFEIDQDQLIVYTVSSGKNVVQNISIGSQLIINGITTTFTRPDGVGTIPMNDGVGFYTIRSQTFADVNSPLGISENKIINGSEFTIEPTDSINDISIKIDMLSSNSKVNAFIENDQLVLQSLGTTIDLIGNWNLLNMTAGTYKNGVKQLQETLGSDYRVLTLDGILRVIYRQPSPITVDFTQLSFNIGLDNLTDNSGSRINITTIDENTSFSMRTEVFEGSFTGEYPITKKGFNDFSTQVSVLGKDAINISDFILKPLVLGFELNGYRGYDYNSNTGLEFNTPHLQEQTVIITTYNSRPRDLQSRSKIFKGLNNTFEVYNITTDNIAKVIEDAPFGSDFIVIDDATKVGTPNKEKNIPAYIWIDGEMIAYYDVDTTDPTRILLRKLVRGAKGTPFGKNIVAGQEVLDLTNSKINIKDAAQYLLS